MHIFCIKKLGIYDTKNFKHLLKFIFCLKIHLEFKIYAIDKLHIYPKKKAIYMLNNILNTYENKTPLNRFKQPIHKNLSYFIYHIYPKLYKELFFTIYAFFANFANGVSEYESE